MGFSNVVCKALEISCCGVGFKALIMEVCGGTLLLGWSLPTLVKVFVNSLVGIEI